MMLQDITVTTAGQMWGLMTISVLTFRADDRDERRRETESDIKGRRSVHGERKVM